MTVPQTGSRGIYSVIEKLRLLNQEIGECKSIRELTGRELDAVGGGYRLITETSEQNSSKTLAATAVPVVPVVRSLVAVAGTAGTAAVSSLVCNSDNRSTASSA